MEKEGSNERRGFMWWKEEKERKIEKRQKRRILNWMKGKRVERRCNVGKKGWVSGGRNVVGVK